MNEKKKTSTCLVDMDCILVDMLPTWLGKYNEEAQTAVLVEDVLEYDLRKVCPDVRILDRVFRKPGFFYDMKPMPGAVTGMYELMESGYDVVIVTQPPRRAEFAVRDKRRWIQDYFPDYELSNMVFCHRKELIRGAVLIDDKPAHLLNWKEMNPKGLTATITWKYNEHVDVDFRGSKETGWTEFVDFVKKNVKP